MNKPTIIISSILILSAGALFFVFNRKFRKETATAPDEMKFGDTIVPLGNNVNIRSTPNVETGNYIYPNYVGKVGTYLSSELGKDNYVWHKVKLNKPTAKNTEGFVRIDVVKKL